jgi:hypothetical protein
MDWIPHLDMATQQAAIAFPLLLPPDPVPQFQGRAFNPESWGRRILHPAHWPQFPIHSNPETIIAEFAAGHYLEGLALVVSWGTMWRTADYIYGERPLLDIGNALHECAESIQHTGFIEEAWLILTGNEGNQLHWTPVMASKTLHFLCRALGHHDDPPVAIDNAVMLNNVWPHWQAMIPHDQRPGSWRGRDFSAYKRYMTAIFTWAQARNWSTTEIEASIFGGYG